MCYMLLFVSHHLCYSDHLVFDFFSIVLSSIHIHIQQRPLEMASVPPTATQKLFDSSYGNSQVTKNTFVRFLITQSVFKVSSLYMNKDNKMNSLLCNFTLCESFLQEIPFFKLLNYIVLVLCWKILSQMWMWCFENLSKKRRVWCCTTSCSGIVISLWCGPEPLKPKQVLYREDNWPSDTRYLLSPCLVLTLCSA